MYSYIQFIECDTVLGTLNVPLTSIINFVGTEDGGDSSSLRSDSDTSTQY